MAAATIKAGQSRQSANMNPGEDQTDKQEDARLAEEALNRQNQMPFYESEPPIVYAPRE